MIMRYPLVLACVLSLPLLAAADDGYRAAYKLVAGPLKVGEVERSFEVHADGAYSFVSKLRATGVVSIVRQDELLETSTGTFQEGNYYPAHYTYLRKNKKKPRDIDMHFDRQNADIRTVVNGETLSSPLRDQVLDKLIYQAALMHDLKMGKTDLSYRIADRGREKIYTPELAGKELIETDAGRFDTLKVTRNRGGNDKRRTIFWCAPELGYLPVQIAYREKSGKETIAVLTEYHRIEPTAP